MTQDVIDLLIEMGKVAKLTAAQAELLKQLSAGDYDTYVKEPPLAIICRFDRDSAHYEKASQLSTGQKVKVRGRYSKVKSDEQEATAAPHLDGCELVEQGPDPLVPAERLIKEFATKPKDAAVKYRRERLLIGGTVAAIEQQPPTVYLEGQDPKAEKPCRVRIANFDKKALAKLKQGQKVKVIGQCATGKPDSVDVWYVKLVSP
jgi:putative nucleic acid binding protein